MPIRAGDNDISIKVFDQKRNKYSKNFIHMFQMIFIQFRSTYDLKYSYYDNGNIDIENRVEDAQFSMLQHSIGLGSLKSLCLNITNKMV